MEKMPKGTSSALTRAGQSVTSLKYVPKGSLPNATVGTDRSFEALMAALKTHVLARRIRLTSFFEDHDKLRHGEVTRAHFRGALSQMNFTASDVEATTIEDAFKAESVDSTGETLVLWKSFAKMVDSVFTVADLETNPTHDVFDSVSACYL